MEIVLVGKLTSNKVVIRMDSCADSDPTGLLIRCKIYVPRDNGLP